MSTIIDSIEKEQLRRVPRFAAGDRVRVHFRVVEGNRTRTQVFEGVVIKRQGSGLQESFTVRKQSFGVGVERTFPVHSPKIEKLEIAARGDVRRAKLYYLRDRVGKAARVAERRWGIEEDVLEVEPEGPVDAEGQAQEEVEPEVVPAEEQGGGPVDPEAADAAEPGDAQAPDAGAVDDETGEAAEDDDAAGEDGAPEGAGPEESVAEGADETGGGSEPDAEEASEQNS